MKSFYSEKREEVRVSPEFSGNSEKGCGTSLDASLTSHSKRMALLKVYDVVILRFPKGLS